MTKRVFDAIPHLTVKGEALHQLSDAAAGSSDVITLRLASDVVDRETVTIGGVVHEIVVVNTAFSPAATSTVLDSTATTNVIETITTHGLVVGDVVRCESEFLRVVTVRDVNTVELARGAFGSTVASHADATALTRKATTALTSGAKKLPVSSTLTPAAAGPQIAAALNYHEPSGFSAEYNTNEVFMWRDGSDAAIACSETLSGANNTIDATSRLGVARGATEWAVAARVPTAAEVALGVMRFQFPFDVKFVRVSVQVTSSLAAVAWGGTTTFSGGRVTLTNGTDPDFAATHTVTVEVHGI